MFLTSPVINDSEKSILAFHSCDRNANRNCLAVNLPRISWQSGVNPDPTTRSDEETHVSYVNRDKVLQRLAHLQTLDVQVTSVQEIVHPRMAVVIRLTREMGLSRVNCLVGCTDVSLSVPLLELVRYRGEGRRDRCHPNECPCRLPIFLMP